MQPCCQCAHAPGLVWTQSYDDFPVLSLAQLCESTSSSKRMFLGLHSWEVEWGSDKDLPFENIFTALGVQFSLQDLNNKLDTVSN